MKRENGPFERGATLVDYALLVALISLVVIASVRVVGRKVACMVGGTAYSISGETGMRYDSTDYFRHTPGSFVGQSSWLMSPQNIDQYINCKELW